MAAVNHVKAILDALEIRVLSREDGVVLLVAVGIERLAEIPDVPRIPRIFRVIQKTRNIPLDGFHVAGKRIDFGPVVIREEEDGAFVRRRLVDLVVLCTGDSHHRFAVPLPQRGRLKIVCSFCLYCEPLRRDAAQGLDFLLFFCFGVFGVSSSCFVRAPMQQF